MYDCKQLNIIPDGRYASLLNSNQRFSLQQNQSTVALKCFTNQTEKHSSCSQQAGGTCALTNAETFTTFKKQTWCRKRIHFTKYYIFAILEICHIKSKQQITQRDRGTSQHKVITTQTNQKHSQSKRELLGGEGWYQCYRGTLSRTGERYEAKGAVLTE